MYDLITLMESYQVYDDSDVNQLVDLFLGGAERDRLDPILDACTAVYKQLELDDQIKFKSAAKSFVRTYGFLGAILPYGNVEWEKLSIFMNLLIPKLPSPRDDDLSEGILQTIDLSSYRNEAQEAIAIKLEDDDAEIAPVPAGTVGHIVEPEMDLLSKIIMDFNDMFGNINWNDADNVQRQILAIPEMVSKDKKYQNSDEQEARTESERALQQVIFSIMADNMELFKQFQDNPSFKKWLSDLVFNLTYNPEGKPYLMPGAEKKNLGAACAYFGVHQDTAHRALSDAYAAHDLYQELKRRFGKERPELFTAKMLQYKAKKERTASKRQKEHLQDLLKYHRIDITVEIDHMSGNEISRMIDKIIFQYGRIPENAKKQG